MGQGAKVQQRRKREGGQFSAENTQLHELQRHTAVPLTDVTPTRGFLTCSLCRFVTGSVCQCWNDLCTRRCYAGSSHWLGCYSGAQGLRVVLGFGTVTY